MSWACREIQSLIDRRAWALTEAELLRLEQHLGSCATCRETAQLMQRVTDLAQESSPTLSASARTRVITSALSVLDRPEARPTLTLRGAAGPAWAMLAAAAALLVFAVGTWHLNRAGNLARKPAARLAVSAPKTQVDSEVAALAPAPGTWVEAEHTQTRLFADANVTLEAGARAFLDDSARRVRLERGRIEVDVLLPQARLEIITQRVRVELLGSHARVSMESITSLRGNTQVTSLASGAAPRRVAVGESRSFEELISERPTAQQVDVGAWLVRARNALAEGKINEARALALQAERAGARRAQRAEIDTLRAECLLLERDSAGAIRQYLLVADRYAGLAASDNAAFAAAQLADRSGDRARAKQLIERYLQRHPKGRFVREATARLSQFE